MPIKFVFAILFSLQILSKSEWTPIYEIYNLDEFHSSALNAIYQDSSSHIIHIITQGWTKTATYLAVFKNGTLFYSHEYEEIEMLDITGADNNKNLFIVQTYHLKPEFSESFDNGLTWQKPYEIEGEEITKMKILFVKETGRLFVFYYSDKTKEISYILRSPNSSIFSNPKCIRKNASEKFSIAYLLVNKTAVLFMIYADNENKISILTSYDNGITWKNMMLENEIIGYPLTFIVNSNIFFTYENISDHSVYLNGFDINGKNIIRQISLTNNAQNQYNGLSGGISICGTLKNKFIISFYLVQNAEKPYYSLFNLTSRKLTYRENPFNSLYSASIKCRENSYKSEITIIAVKCNNTQNCKILMSTEILSLV